MLNKSLTVGLLIALLLGWSVLVCGHLLTIQPLTEHEQVQTISENGHEFESNGILSLALEQTIRDTFGPCRATLRLYPLTCHVLTIVAVFALGTVIGGKRLGLLSAFVHAVSAWSISVAIHVRFYAINDLFVALSTLFLLLAVTKKQKCWWWLYGLCLLGCVSSMVLSLLVVIFHFFILLACQRQSNHPRQHYTTFTVCVALALCLLGFLFQRDRDAVYRFTYPPVSLTTVVDQLNLSLASGTARPHMPSFYDESKAASLEYANNWSKCLFAINALAVLCALIALWRPKCRQRYATTDSGVCFISVFGRSYVLAVIIVVLLIGGLGVVNHHTFINSDTFTWLLPLQSVFLALALNETWCWETLDNPTRSACGALKLRCVDSKRKTSRPIWFWLACTALIGAAPLLAHATYMNGCGDEAVFVWISQLSNKSDVVYVDEITKRNWQYALSRDLDLSLLNRLTTFKEPRRYHPDNNANYDFESHRVYSAMQQLSSDQYRLGHRVWLLTEHVALPCADQRFAYIERAARLHGMSARVLAIDGGRMSRSCLYQIVFEKIRPLKPTKYNADKDATTSKPQGLSQGTSPQKRIPQGPSLQRYTPQGPSLQKYIPQGPSLQKYIPQGPSLQQYTPQGPSLDGPASQEPNMRQDAPVGPQLRPSGQA